MGGSEVSVVILGRGTAHHFISESCVLRASSCEQASLSSACLLHPVSDANAANAA